MSTHNFEELRRAVLNASASYHWAQAVDEWQVLSLDEDPTASGVCVCGKTGLVYLYNIENRQTQQALFPIGSSCVRYFGVDELNLSVNVLRRLLDLRAAFAAGERVELTKQFFTRAVLADLWESGAFPPNEYNRGNGDNDYRFLVDLFNRRTEITDNESKKVWVLLNRTIGPFVMSDERLR